MTADALPDLALSERLDRSFASLALEGSPSERAKLIGFLDLLQKWSATYNLTAIRGLERMLTHHIVDSLAVVAPLRRHSMTSRVRQLVDAGSGAGLPGVVLAVMLPEVEVTCVDAVGKKASFVRQVAAELALPNLRSIHSRLEGLSDVHADVVASRAFATLADMVRATDALTSSGGVWMAMKGKHPEVEIEALPAHVEVFHVEPLTVPGLDADRCLVWIHRKASL